jgi:hypothetical protein
MWYYLEMLPWPMGFSDTIKWISETLYTRTREFANSTIEQSF